MTQSAISPAFERENRLKRLRYQSWHRGCKETDVVLGNYCDAELAMLSDTELDLYEQLLNEDDWDIWQWVAYNTTPPNPEFLPLIEKLRIFRGYAAY